MDTIEQLYEKHKKELTRFAKSLTRNEKEAEDLLQETFVRSLGHASKLNEMIDFQQRAWLFKVIRNIFYDKRRRGRFETTLENEVEPEVPFSDNDLEIRDLLDSLPTTQYELVYRRYWLGMNSKQIAKVMKIPDSTVRYRLQKALHHLRKQI